MHHTTPMNSRKVVALLKTVYASEFINDVLIERWRGEKSWKKKITFHFFVFSA